MTTRWIVPLNDNEIISRLLGLKKKYNASVINAQFMGKSLAFVEEDQLLNKIKAASGFSITYFSVTFGQNTFTYNSDNQSNTPLAKFDANHSPQVTQEANQDEFTISVLKQFGAPPPSGPASSGESSFAAGFTKIESALSGAVDRFEQFQLGFQERTQKLRDEHEQSMTAFEVRLNEQKSLLEIEVAQKHEALEAARKELDDRSNTHARRSIRNELKASVTESLDQPSFAKNSETGRRYVRKVYLLAISILVIYAGISLLLLNTAMSQNSAPVNSTAVWLTGIKASIASISTIGLILLYLRWETQWLNQQAAFERMLSSTRVDIDRASWVAESLLEWNRVSAPTNPMPNELLQSFTRRLFDWDAKVEDNHSAQDSLASAILGSAAKIQIGPDGANLEYDRKSLKELEKK